MMEPRRLRQQTMQRRLPRDATAQILTADTREALAPWRVPTTLVRMSRTSFNKSAWIRSQPASLSAKEVIEKAKREGLSLSASSLHVEFQQLAVRLGTEEAQRLLAQLPPLVLAQL